MSAKRNLTLKLFLFMVATDILETVAQFCFKKSVAGINAGSVANFREGLAFIGRVIPSPFLWIGLFSVLVIFITWSAILSKVDLSVAVPVCSFSYITVPLVSSIFLHEEISATRWQGIIFILIGVIFVSISSKIGEKRR